MKQKVNLPNFSIEKKLLDQNYKRIAGIDEVGRGTLAGPVVACAAILPNAVPSIKKNLVNDSKKLSAKKRIESFEWLRSWCLDYAIGSSSNDEIDTYGNVQIQTDADGYKFFKITFTGDECVQTSEDPEQWSCSSPILVANLLNANGATSEQLQITINNTCLGLN